ncbi:hypothetical protein MU484_14075, partial [Staphylococcus aureus]|nr:hypothetical protein [Staphylococcus aureus]
ALPDVYAGSYADLVNIFPLYDENGELKPTHSNDICDIWLFKAVSYTHLRAHETLKKKKKNKLYFNKMIKLGGIKMNEGVNVQ